MKTETIIIIVISLMLFFPDILKGILGGIAPQPSAGNIPAPITPQGGIPLPHPLPNFPYDKPIWV